MNIRLAEDHEINTIMELYKAVVKEMNANGLFNWDEKYPSKEIVEKDIKNKCLYVFEEEGTIVALSAIDEKADEVYKCVHWHEKTSFFSFHRIAVHPNFHGRGYAKKIIAFAEELGKKRGYKSMRIDAYCKNEKAIGLYEKLGYERVGEVLLRDLQEPCYCYEKEL